MLVTYKLKGLDRENLLPGYRSRRYLTEGGLSNSVLKQLGGRNRRLIWWTSIAASIVVLVVAGYSGVAGLKSGTCRPWQRRSAGQSRAVVTLADGQQIVLSIIVK
ncbi:MAG: hypothetical protein ACLUDU_10980 [Butyricimonas faecihominis]